VPQHNKAYILQAYFRHDDFTFLIKSATRKDCSLAPVLFNIVLEFLTRVIKGEKHIKGILIGKEAVKLSIIAEDKILYINDLKNSTKNS
jgi:hypothetical protein